MNEVKEIILSLDKEYLLCPTVINQILSQSHQISISLSELIEIINQINRGDK